MFQNKSPVQWFALLYGLAFVMVGLAGFAEHGTASHEVLLFDTFPVNLAHSFAHLLIGAAGIVVFFRTVAAAVLYSRITGILYLLLAIVGLVDPTFFGLMPIGGADIALHFGAAILALFFGFLYHPVARGREIPHH